MASDRHLARLRDGAAAWNRWRREEPLVRPDLQGLSLSLAQKQWGETSGGPINLSQSMLREADLRYATLIDADLAGASLIGADLSGARLRNADLRNANLSNVRFDGADLANAQFAGANLSGADLSGARNLSFSQIEAAEGDAKTLLPQPLVTPSVWRNGAVVDTRIAVSAETLRATAEAYYPSVLRSYRQPNGDPFGDRFGRALHGQARPRLDAVAEHVQAPAIELPRRDTTIDRVKAAFEGLPRPRFSAITDRAMRAIKSFPRPQPADAARRVGLALSGLPHPRVIAATAVVGLVVVFGFGGLLALRSLQNQSVDATPPQSPSSAVVADTRAAPEKEF